MDLAKRQRLEAAGFRVGSPQDFLKLSKPECELIELRLLLESAIRERKHTIDATEAMCTQDVVSQRLMRCSVITFRLGHP